MAYIDNKLKYKIWNDLKLYTEKQIESTFLEIIEPNLRNKIVGCIYKHPNVPVTEFTNDYMGLFLEKLSHEWKEIILLDDFSINILKLIQTKIQQTCMTYKYTTCIHHHFVLSLTLLLKLQQPQKH